MNSKEKELIEEFCYCLKQSLGRKRNRWHSDNMGLCTNYTRWFACFKEEKKNIAGNDKMLLDYFCDVVKDSYPFNDSNVMSYIQEMNKGRSFKNKKRMKFVEEWAERYEKRMKENEKTWWKGVVGLFKSH